MDGIKLIALFGALAVTGWGCSNSLTPASKSGTQSANPDTTGEQAAPTVTAQDTLFTIISNPTFNENQKKYLLTIANSPITEEVRIVRLHKNAETLLKKGNLLALPVAKEKLIIAKIKKETRRSTGDISWGGPLQNSKGWAGFVLSTKGLTGTIDIYGAGDYKVLPIGDNLHAVVLPDSNVNLID